MTLTVTSDPFHTMCFARKLMRASQTGHQLRFRKNVLQTLAGMNKIPRKSLAFKNAGFDLFIPVGDTYSGYAPPFYLP